LAEGLGDQRRLGQICAYMTWHAWDSAGFDHAIAAGQRALSIAAALGDVGLQVTTQCFLGQAYYFLGDYRRALDVLRSTVACLTGKLLYERFGLGELASVHSRIWLVASLAELGAFAEGSIYNEEVVRIAEATNHPYHIVHTRFSVGLLSFHQGDLDKAIAALEQGVELCQRWDIQIWFGNIASLLGLAYARSGRLADALPLLEQVEAFISHPSPGTHFFLRSGEAYLLAGRLEEAHARAERALTHAREYQRRGQQAYVLHLLGAIAARREPPERAPAEAYYRQALALAEALGMRPLQAHCHLGLGTLYATSGQREPAGAALATAIDLYRAMDMTFWLPQAAALAQVA
jgi:tetratricopeptide (TPR) repeat protein